MGERSHNYVLRLISDCGATLEERHTRLLDYPAPLYPYFTRFNTVIAATAPSADAASTQLQVRYYLRAGDAACTTYCVQGCLMLKYSVQGEFARHFDHMHGTQRPKGTPRG